MNDQAQRLKNLLNALKTTQSKFSRAIGVKVSQTNAICNSREKLSSGYLEKVSSKFPEINTHWLLTGTGDMIIPAHGHTYVLEEPLADYKSINPLQIYEYNDDLILRKTLGNNLNDLIFTWGLKKYELFAMLMPGVLKQSVTNYLNGSSQLPLYALIRLERMSGVAIIDWITRPIIASELPRGPMSQDAKKPVKVDFVVKELRSLIGKIE